VSSPKNGVTEQGRRIGEYSALPADEKKRSLSAHHEDERTTLGRGYMAPRQYRLKKRPRGIPSEIRANQEAEDLHYKYRWL
jgi:hypothetical protein